MKYPLPALQPTPGPSQEGSNEEARSHKEHEVFLGVFSALAAYPEHQGISAVKNFFRVVK